MKKHYLFVPFFIFIFIFYNTGNIQGQTELISDSLEYLLQTKRDTSTVLLHIEIGQQYSGSMPEMAEEHFQKALAILPYIPKVHAEEFEALISVVRGDNYYADDDYGKATELYAASIPYFEEKNDIPRLISVYTRIASVCRIMTEATKQDNQEERAVQRRQEMEYYKKVIELVSETDNKISKIDGFSAYVNFLIMEEKYDSAKIYLEKMYTLSKEIDNFQGLIVYFGNSGFVEEKLGNIKKAIEYYYKTYEIAIDVKEYAYAAQGLSSAAFTAGNNISSDNDLFALYEKYSLMGLELSDSFNLKDSKWRFLENLSDVAGQKGEFEKALKYKNDAVSIYQDIFSEQHANQINHYIARYEKIKREAAIIQLEDENQMKTLKLRNFQWFIFALALFLLLGVIISLYRQRISRHKIKNLEQEKQLVATQAVLDGETAERSRLAKDLHDGLGGMLSTIKLNLSGFKKKNFIEGEDMKQFDHALLMLNESIKELRRVAHNMMPDSLTRYGLKVSLTDFCNSVPGAQFHYFGTGERLDPKLEVMIYRIAHELVNNALKHSGAGHIVVQIVQESNRIVLTVQDNGRGFDTAAPSQGTGLNNIHVRVNSYNGQMSIWSELGKGTEINIEFKLIVL